MAYPVFDLHCDTATMLSLRNVPADVVMAAGVPEALIPAAGVPWLQCFACFIPDGLDAEQGG